MNDNTLRDAVQTATPAAGNHPVSLDREAVAWAWAQPVANNPGARIVLLCLAVMADDVWECMASQEEIAGVALVPARSVRRYVDHLEANGHIRRSKRYDEDGHRLPDLYRLDPARSLPAKLDGRQVNPVANLAGSTPDLLAKLDDKQVGPPANLASRDAAYPPDWPVGNRDEPETPSSEPAAKLASRRPDQRPNWPVGDPEETDIPSSEPVANLAGSQIQDKRSSSPTENYENKNLSSSSSDKKQRAKAKPTGDTPPREDVERLCARLLGWMKHNQVRKTPDAVSDTWRREARLLLDKDEVPLEEAFQVLDWSQRDGFWSQNVHSMPTFRDKYGQLEMKSRGHRGDARVHQLRPTGTTGPTLVRSTTDDRVAQAQALKGRFGPAAPSTIAGEISS